MRINSTRMKPLLYAVAVFRVSIIRLPIGIFLIILGVIFIGRSVTQAKVP